MPRSRLLGELAVNFADRACVGVLAFLVELAGVVEHGLLSRLAPLRDPLQPARFLRLVGGLVHLHPDLLRLPAFPALRLVLTPLLPRELPHRRSPLKSTAVKN